MEVSIYVIKDCMYCDTLLKGLPKVVKKFPNVTFKVTCVTESKEFELFPTVVVGDKTLSPCIYAEDMEKEVRHAVT